MYLEGSMKFTASRLTSTVTVYEIDDFKRLAFSKPKTYGPGKVTHGIRLNGKERHLIATKAKAMRAFGLLPSIESLVSDYFG